MTRTVHPLIAQLADARRAARLSQVDIADEIGLNPRSVGQWERGERTPDLRYLTAYATVLGMELTLTEVPR